MTKRWWLKWLFILFVCLFTCGLYVKMVANNTFVEVDIKVTEKSYFKIYWANENGHYSERRMAEVRVHPKLSRYSFYLTDLRKIDKIRIDPYAYKGGAVLRSLTLQQPNLETMSYQGPDQLRQLKALNQIGLAEYVESAGGLKISSTGADPFFEISLQKTPVPQDPLWLFVRLLVISILIALVCHCSSSLVKDFKFVPLLLFGVFMLVILMAGISKRNVHPDEYVHMHAVEYYNDHWMPPVLDDPEISHTYSVYGFSRLNHGEIYYLFAGKFDKLFESFQMNQYMSNRLFNVALFGFILLYCLKNISARVVALPILVSSQVWYVFSYCNSDAFAYFVAFILGVQLVDPRSLLHRYLKGESWGSFFAGLSSLGLVLGILFLLKKNYYPYVAFFYLCLGAKVFLTEEYYWERKQAMARLALLSLLALVVCGLRIGADYYVNGLDKAEKIAVLQEERAHKLYKPSTPLMEKNPSLYHKEKGTTIEQMNKQYHWDEKIFRSSFGVYGYFTISGSELYYTLVSYAGTALLCYLVLALLIRGGWIGGGVCLSALGLSVALIGASFYHSWTIDFQAQGRYLLPILAMFGVAYGWSYKKVYTPPAIFGVVCMYLLACYSFIFTALIQIPKAPV